MKITKITKIANEPVFDIMVEAAHHYILDNGVITHNSGLEYAASTIVFLSKKKDKDKKRRGPNDFGGGLGGGGGGGGQIGYNPQNTQAPRPRPQPAQAPRVPGQKR
jgi:hypothetical protein